MTKSELVVTFKDSLMANPDGLQYKILADYGSGLKAIKTSTVEGSKNTLKLKFISKDDKTVKITGEGVNVTGAAKSEYLIQIFITDKSGVATKKIAEGKLKAGKKITLVIVSPWTKIPLSSGTFEESGDFFDVDYKLKRVEKIESVKITIKDIPRKILLTALKYRDSALWSTYVKKSSTHPKLNETVTFKNPSNKCNQFVNDVLTEVGISVPWPDLGRGRHIPLYETYTPPTAGMWADSERLVENWAFEEKALPGDVGAYKALYRHATGHVGFVISADKTGGVTISAGELKIEVNDSGFRHRNKTATSRDIDFTAFRRYKPKVIK